MEVHANFHTCTCTGCCTLGSCTVHDLQVWWDDQQIWHNWYFSKWSLSVSTLVFYSYQTQWIEKFIVQKKRWIWYCVQVFQVLFVIQISQWLPITTKLGFQHFHYRYGLAFHVELSFPEVRIFLKKSTIFFAFFSIRKVVGHMIFVDSGSPWKRAHFDLIFLFWKCHITLTPVRYLVVKHSPAFLLPTLTIVNLNHIFHHRSCHYQPCRCSCHSPCHCFCCFFCCG